MIANIPRVSIRDADQQTGVSKSTIKRIIRQKLRVIQYSCKLVLSLLINTNKNESVSLNTLFQDLKMIQNIWKKSFIRIGATFLCQVVWKGKTAASRERNVHERYTRNRREQIRLWFGATNLKKELSFLTSLNTRTSQGKATKECVATFSFPSFKTTLKTLVSTGQLCTPLPCSCMSIFKRKAW